MEDKERMRELRKQIRDLARERRVILRAQRVLRIELNQLKEASI